MVIQWHGFGCLRIQSKETTLLVDPFPTTNGLTAPRIQAHLFLFTDPENPQIQKANDAQGFVIAQPGEYEIHGVTVRGVPVEENGSPRASHTLFLARIEEVTLGFCGGLSRVLTEQELEGLDDIDVAFVPVGGKPVLNAEQASKLMSQLEPRIVIPTHYRVAGMKGTFDGVEKFCKDMGVKTTDTEDKVRIVKKDLPEGETKVVLLKP